MIDLQGQCVKDLREWNEKNQEFVKIIEQYGSVERLSSRIKELEASLFGRFGDPALHRFHGQFSPEHNYRAEGDRFTFTLNLGGCPGCMHMADKAGLGDAARQWTKARRHQNSALIFAKRCVDLVEQIDTNIYKLNYHASNLRIPRFKAARDGSGLMRSVTAVTELAVGDELIFYRGVCIDYVPASEGLDPPGVLVENRDLSYRIGATKAITPIGLARAVFDEIERLAAYTLDGRSWRIVSRH